jgi:hypothetical protein
MNVNVSPPLSRELVPFMPTVDLFMCWAFECGRYYGRFHGYFRSLKPRATGERPDTSVARAKGFNPARHATSEKATRV